MGHWMSNNADQVFVLQVIGLFERIGSIIWTRYIRQGEEQDVSYQFDQPQPPFLVGFRTDYIYLGGEVKI